MTRGHQSNVELHVLSWERSLAKRHLPRAYWIPFQDEVDSVDQEMY